MAFPGVFGLCSGLKGWGFAPPPQHPPANDRQDLERKYPSFLPSWVVPLMYVLYIAQRLLPGFNFSGPEETPAPSHALGWVGFSPTPPYKWFLG